MKVTIAAGAQLLLLHLEGPCYPTLRTVLVYPQRFAPKVARSPGTGQVAPPPVRLMGESWGDGVVVISWDDTMLDEYGATNKTEFFAVATERSAP
jgi:Mlc titration factor MtfA (ptsG expression regulator)